MSSRTASTFSIVSSKGPLELAAAVPSLPPAKGETTSSRRMHSSGARLRPPKSAAAGSGLCGRSAGSGDSTRPRAVAASTHAIAQRGRRPADGFPGRCQLVQTGASRRAARAARRRERFFLYCQRHNFNAQELFSNRRTSRRNQAVQARSRTRTRPASSGREPLRHLSLIRSMSHRHRHSHLTSSSPPSSSARGSTASRLHGASAASS